MMDDRELPMPRGVVRMTAEAFGCDAACALEDLARAERLGVREGCALRAPDGREWTLVRMRASVDGQWRMAMRASVREAGQDPVDVPFSRVADALEAGRLAVKE